MRIAVVRSAAALVVAGAVTGVLVALALQWWAVRHRPTEIGVFSYSMPRRYVDYLPVTESTDWWGLLWPAVVAGLGVGLVVAIVIALLGRRVTLERTR